MSQTTTPRLTARELLRRTGTLTWLKATGTTVIMTVFFLGYFALLRNPLFPVTTVPTTWIDGLVGLHAWALIPYFSLWVYVSMPASWMTERRELWSYALGAIGLGAAGLGVFLFYPTIIAPADVDWSLYPSFQFLKSADTSGNACPSLHVAFAVFSGLWFVRLLSQLGGGWLAQAVNALWAALIVHSTLATHQHVALDALFGSVLGAHAAAINCIVFPGRDRSAGDRRVLWCAVVIIKACAVLLWTSGIPWGWCLAVFLSAGALALFHQFAPNAQGLARVFSRFKTDRREVWLTIDDGPHPEDTPRLLELLDRHQAKATFFLVGERAARHPELVAEIARRGHEIGHHTHRHADKTFWASTPGRVRREIDEALPALTIEGRRPTRFRCPVGIKPFPLAAVLASRGMNCIGWSVRSRDSFAKSPDDVAARVLGAVRPGAIILMHEGPPVSAAVRVQAIAKVLEGLSAQGYRCVVPEASSLV